MNTSKFATKLFIKFLIISMIIIGMILISSLLYILRFWPDLLNYINANITIKRIPTISELELTVIGLDYTTEPYTTTDMDYLDISTMDDVDLEDFLNDNTDIKRHTVSKRNAVMEPIKYFNEPESILIDYDFIGNPVTNETTPKPVTDNSFDSLVKANVIEVPIDLTEDIFIVSKYNRAHALMDEKYEEEFETTPNTINITEASKPITIDEEYFLNHSHIIIDKLASAEKQSIAIKAYKNIEDLVEDEQHVNFMSDLDNGIISARGMESVEIITRRTGKTNIEIVSPDPVCHNDVFCKQFTKTVFPWVVTIFVTRTTTQSQFSYFCDGALITDRVILTAARCMHVGNSTWEPQNVLVFLGKTNLQTFAENEKVQKIKYIVFHPKYKVDGEGNAVNDLALLVMEDSVEFKENIQTACIHAETSMHVTATTAWSNTGALVPIFFKSNRSEICYDKSGDIVCATYGNDVALCPSYGGSFASNQANRWCLQGIMHGNPAERGPCFNKNVHYTLLANYLTWIDETVGLYKNDIL